MAHLLAIPIPNCVNFVRCRRKAQVILEDRSHKRIGDYCEPCGIAEHQQLQREERLADERTREHLKSAGVEHSR